MARPIILGVVGDSAAGKTTITRGLVRVIGDDNVTHVCTDDYHRFDRRQRAERNITPLNPECNHIDIMAQHLGHLRSGEPFMKPVYQHHDGTFGPLVRVEPEQFAVVEGLLGYSTEEMRRMYDVRVYLNPPEELRRKWKVQRDCSKRGYTTDQVLSELDRREPDSEAFIRPQREFADIVVSFLPGDKVHLDSEIVLRSSLQHPKLASIIGGCPASRIRVSERDDELHLWIPGDLKAGPALEIEEQIWRDLHFASHLRTERLGELTLGGDRVVRSESLALIQLLVLYHLFTATASVALGGNGTRVSERESIAT
jgi:phosphoribulokinase